ncbi:MAG TPA: type II secretion system F family protein [Gemmatimonadota bacterium]|nr:type II secretion system F family protein [Gemmatimonadota bacterium]
MQPNLVAALIAFAAVACGVLAMVFAWEWWRDRRRQKEIVERIGALSGGRAAPGVDPFGSLFRDQKQGDARWMAPLVARMPHLVDLQQLLEQSDVGWRVGTFLLLTFGAAAAFGMAALLFTGLWFVALAAAALGATMPYVYVRRRKAKRLDAFEEAFPEAIDLLGRAIRAGHAFSTGLQMVADESPEPLATEFRQVFEEQRFGLPLEDTLLGMADRIDLVDMRIFVTAVLIQREVGGNLAEILDNIAHTIRERFTIQRQVRVYTAQGRFTGYLLAGLPILLGLVVYTMNREYMNILFIEPVGRMMITIAAILQVMGYFVIRKIIDIDI